MHARGLTGEAGHTSPGVDGQNPCQLDPSYSGHTSNLICHLSLRLPAHACIMERKRPCMNVGMHIPAFMHWWIYV